MNRPTREKDIEKYFCECVKRAGGIAYKFTSPQRRSVPDRLVVMPGGLIYFVEVKNGKSPYTEGQEREIKRLTELGQKVYTIRSKEEARVISELWGLC